MITTSSRLGTEIAGAPTLVLRVEPHVRDRLNPEIGAIFIIDATRLVYEIRIQPQVCSLDASPTCTQTVAQQRGVFDQYLNSGTASDVAAAPDVNLNVLVSARLTEVSAVLGATPACPVLLPFVPLPLPLPFLFSSDPGADPGTTCAAATIAAEVVLRPQLLDLFDNFSRYIGGAGGPGLSDAMITGLPRLDGSMGDVALLPFNLNTPRGVSSVFGTAPGMFNATSMVILERGARTFLPPVPCGDGADAGGPCPDAPGSAPLTLAPSPNLDNLFSWAPQVANTSRRIFSGPIETMVDRMDTLRRGLPQRQTRIRFTSITGGAGNATFNWILDRDVDGLDDRTDVCDWVADPVPTDTDEDGLPDACDTCPSTASLDSADDDGDGIQNACDCNIDGDVCADALADGVLWLGAAGECTSGPFDREPLHPADRDVDRDGIVDDCDPVVDSDGDGVGDATDNCGDVPNPDQANSGGHPGLGDACDPLCSSPGSDCLDPGDFMSIGLAGLGGARCIFGPGGGCRWLIGFRGCQSGTPGCEDEFGFFDPDPANDFTFGPGPRFGLPVGVVLEGAQSATLPDRDGDGYEEPVLGAPRSTVCPPNSDCLSRAGVVVVYSSRTGAILQTLRGQTAGERLGSSLLSLQGRLVVGAIGLRDARGLRTGGAYVFDFTWSSPRIEAQFFGGNRGEKLGHSLASVGDINGDGLTDFLVSAPAARTPAGPHSGRVELRERSGRILRTFESPIRNARMGDDSSVMVARANDPGGVVIGARRAGRGGAAFFFDWSGRLLWSVTGAAGDELGSAVAPAFDYDGNGRLEVAIGAPGANRGRGQVIALNALGRRLGVLTIPRSRQFGRSLGVPGDLNGDQRAELFAEGLFGRERRRWTVVFSRSDGPNSPPPPTDAPWAP